MAIVSPRENGGFRTGFKGRGVRASRQPLFRSSGNQKGHRLSVFCSGLLLWSAVCVPLFWGRSRQCESMADAVKLSIDSRTRGVVDGGAGWHCGQDRRAGHPDAGETRVQDVRVAVAAEPVLEKRLRAVRAVAPQAAVQIPGSSLRASSQER